MFFTLMWKELKLIFKSIIFYLFAVTVILFYITQYGEYVPVNADKPLQPLSEMQFMYTKLLEDYHDGTLTNKALKDSYALIMMNTDVSEEFSKRYVKANDYSLDVKEKAAVRDVLEEMNPGAVEGNENILNIKFHISNDEYLALMQKLDASLGGHTYYWDKEAKTCLLAAENSYGSTEVTDPLENIRYAYYQIRTSWATGNVKSIRAGMEYFKPIDEEQSKLLEDAMDKILPDGIPDGITDEENLNFTISFEECLDMARELDGMLGVNQFEEAVTGKNHLRNLTYEEAMNNFNKLFGGDKITNAYARYLSDYMGITAGFLPVFLAVFVLIRDKRSRMAELIYCREVSSYEYVFSKFAAVTLAVMLCYMGIAAHSTIVFADMAGIYGYNIDYLAFFKYSLAWVMPTALFTTAIGLLFTILFSNGIVAVAVQLVLWFISIMPLGGDYRLFKHIVRFNTVVSLEQYESWFPAIFTNRLFFTLLSFGLVATASAVLSWKRSSGVEMKFKLFKFR
jgi:ABC-type transport system involved in multi-copper enzyme maturation permease subunit